MPRRNHTPPHQPYDPSPLTHSQPKRAFQSKRAAEAAAKAIMRYELDLELYVYQSPTDGKWYLSSGPNTQYF